jgi:phage terminase small subunit
MTPKEIVQARKKERPSKGVSGKHNAGWEAKKAAKARMKAKAAPIASKTDPKEDLKALRKDISVGDQGGWLFGRIGMADCDAIAPGWRQHGTMQEAVFVIAYLRSNDKTAAANLAYPNAKPKPNGEVVILRPSVQKILGLATKNLVGAKFNELRMRLTSMLWERAFYDPKNYFNPDGTPAFQSWDEVPPYMRCVIDNIETKAYGKDAFMVTTMKTANRMESLKMMMELAQAGTLVASDDGVKKLEHDDLRILFDDNADTFDQANRHLLGEPDPEDEEDQPNVLEAANKKAMAVNPASVGQGSGSLSPPSLPPMNAGAPKPHPSIGVKAPADMLGSLPSREDIKKVTKLASDLEGL